MDEIINQLLKENCINNIRFKNAEYNKNTDTLSVVFKCAYNTDILCYDKEKLKKIVEKVLECNNVNIVIDIKQIYFDEDEFFKFNYHFFETNFNYAIFIDSKKTKFNMSDNKVQFFIDEKYNDSSDKMAFVNSFNKYFFNEFCFEINLDFVAYNHNEQSIILERKDMLLNSEQFGNYYDIEVKILEQIINEIPEDSAYTPICEIKNPKLNYYVCGLLDNITEKQFTKKYVNKEGQEVEQTKKYYSLTIKDDTGNIQGIIFPSKENFEKLKILQNNQQIAIFASVDSFGDKLNLKIKSIALCSYTFSMTTVFKKLPSTFLFVKPTRYESFEQTMLFDYNPEIKSDYLLNNNFVVFDLETTGLDFEKDEIIEIGAVKIEKGQITEQFSTFVNPLIHIPDKASEVNNIFDNMVESAPTIEQVLSDFMLFCNDCIIVAYNTPFDSKFIKKNCKKQFYEFSNQLDDCLDWAHNKILGLKNYKLKTVCDKMNVSLVGAHRAVNDAVATAKLFIKLVEM